tara:strand:- start:86 stop:481 length:396 start_codon:yes stop_codon:yes gene_type:complete
MTLSDKSLTSVEKGNMVLEKIKYQKFLVELCNMRYSVMMEYWEEVITFFGHFTICYTIICRSGHTHEISQEEYEWYKTKNHKHCCKSYLPTSWHRRSHDFIRQNPSTGPGTNCFPFQRGGGMFGEEQKDIW